MSTAIDKALEAIATKLPAPKTEPLEITVIRQLEGMAEEVLGRARIAEDHANEARLAALRMREELRVRRELVEDQLGMSAKCEECERRFIPEKGEPVCLNCEVDPHEAFVGGAV